MKTKIGFISYYTVTILIILFGGMYMLKPSFMPYHSEILDLKWQDISLLEQTLVRALMIATGGVTISVGIILGMLILKFNKTREQWISNYVLISGIIANVLISIAPVYVVIKSDSMPPLYFPVILIALLITGNLLTKQKKSDN